MNIKECTAENVRTMGDGDLSPHVRLTSDVIPEAQSNQFAASSQTGVSTSCVLSGTVASPMRQEDAPHWYVLRATYRRELKAYDYLISKGVQAFCPTIEVVKEINGKRKTITESRLPNIFFAFGTEEQIKKFVYDNVNLPFLRFYYQHVHTNCKLKKIPLVVPEEQMKSLKIICEAEVNDVIVSSTSISKFKEGQLVRVVDGVFRGVVGRVARYQGQQRIAVTVNELLTVCTAYVPKAFIELV